MNGYDCNYDHSAVCAICGKTYGKHYGVHCFMRDEDPKQEKKFKPLKKKGIDYNVPQKKKGIDYHVTCYNCGNYYGNHYNGLCSQAHNSSFFVPAKTDQFTGLRMNLKQAESLAEDFLFYARKAARGEAIEVTLMQYWEDKGYIVEED